jgi:hypothetical protein
VLCCNHQASLPKLSRKECLAWSDTELPSSPEECETLAAKRCATLLLVVYLTLAFPEWYTPAAFLNSLPTIFVVFCS